MESDVLRDAGMRKDEGTDPIPGPVDDFAPLMERIAAEADALRAEGRAVVIEVSPHLRQRMSQEKAAPPAHAPGGFHGTKIRTGSGVEQDYRIVDLGPERIGYRVKTTGRPNALIMDAVQNHLSTVLVPILYGQGNPANIRTDMAVNHGDGYIWWEISSFRAPLPDNWHEALQSAADDLSNEIPGTVVAVEALPEDFDWPFPPAGAGGM